MSAKYDSFQNLLTSLNTGDDKNTLHRFAVGRDEWLQRETLEALYYADGLARVIVDTLTNEMLRKGWSLDIDGDTDKAVSRKLHNAEKRLKFKSVLWEAVRDSQLYGGGAIVLGIRDGSEDPSMPVNIANIQSLDFAVAMNRYQLRVCEYGKDPLDANFQRPLMYEVTEEGSHGTRAAQRIHHSRVLHFNGTILPRRIEENYLGDTGPGFGASILQAAYRPLRNLVTSFDNLSVMVQEFNQAVFQIEGLMQLLAQAGDEGYNVIQRRLRLMNMSRSVVNALVLQEGENYESKSLDLRGLADIMDKLMLHVSAVTRIPITKLMGQSPAGMNATGEADESSWYDHVANQQELRLREPLEKFYSYMLGQDAEFSLDFLPLKEMSEIEIATLRKTHAETDALYIQNTVLYPEEIANSRFGGSEYGDVIQLEDGARDSQLVSEQETFGAFEPESTTPIVTPTGEAITPAETAMNGAQVTSLVQIMASVSNGELPSDSAIEILTVAFPSISKEKATAMVLPAAAAASSQVGNPNTANGESPDGAVADELIESDKATLPTDAISAKQAAQMLGFNGSGPIRKMWQSGKVRAWKIGGRILVSESEVAKAFQANEITANPTDSTPDKTE